MNLHQWRRQHHRRDACDAPTEPPKTPESNSTVAFESLRRYLGLLVDPGHDQDRHPRKPGKTRSPCHPCSRAASQLGALRRQELTSVVLQCVELSIRQPKSNGSILRQPFAPMRSPATNVSPLRTLTMQIAGLNRRCRHRRDCATERFQDLEAKPNAMVHLFPQHRPVIGPRLQRSAQLGSNDFGHVDISWLRPAANTS